MSQGVLTKSKHLRQRGVDLERVCQRFDALCSVGSLSVIVQTAQLVAREVKLQHHTQQKR